MAPRCHATGGPTSSLRLYFVYVQRLARPQNPPVCPSRMKTPGQRRSRRYASAAVGATGTVMLSGPGPMLCGEPDGASVPAARLYPKSVACGKMLATIGTPTLKVMSDGEVIVTVG